MGRKLKQYHYDGLLRQPATFDKGLLETFCTTTLSRSADVIPFFGPDFIEDHQSQENIRIYETKYQDDWAIKR